MCYWYSYQICMDFFFFLKYRNGITITNACNKKLDESSCHEAKSKGQIKYGYIKAADFIIDQWNHG